VELLLALAIVVLVAYVVSVPLRRARGEEANPLEAELADLEARKQAIYRQIRDAEADHAAGKLSHSDFRLLDAELRAEAVAVLKRIDRLRPPVGGDRES
jgi:hypothetical protein